MMSHVSCNQHLVKVAQVWYKGWDSHNLDFFNYRSPRSRSKVTIQSTFLEVSKYGKNTVQMTGCKLLNSLVVVVSMLLLSSKVLWYTYQVLCIWLGFATMFKWIPSSNKIISSWVNNIIHPVSQGDTSKFHLLHCLWEWHWNHSNQAYKSAVGIVQCFSTITFKYFLIYCLLLFFFLFFSPLC